MSATIFNIIGLNEDAHYIANIDTFILSEGKPFDTDQLISNPHISLYCLDIKNRQAVFVELPSDIQLETATFYYELQAVHARQVITLGFADFFLLAQSIKFDRSKLILIHTIGRSGSTLLSKAFNKLDPVLSYSEPDVFTNITRARELPDSEIPLLMTCCMRYIFRPEVVKQSKRYVIKFRGMCLKILDLFCELLPTSQHIFLYRNAVDWITSMYRIRLRSDRPMISIDRQRAIDSFANFVGIFPDEAMQYIPTAYNDFDYIRMASILWSYLMLCVIKNNQESILSLRYEDLKAHPQVVLKALFEHCGLPDEAVSTALKAFEHDSQAGTQFAQGDDVILTDEQRSRVLEMIEYQPLIRTPDVMLPNLLTIE